MEGVDSAAVNDALRAAQAQDDAGTQQAPQTTETVSPTGQDIQSNQTDKPTGLFHDVDPESLTPEMRTVFDGMQKSYTQKSQEIAALRSKYDGFGDVGQVQNAVEFVQSLQDPQNLAQLHSELSDYLQSIGHSKADSDAAAGQTLAEQDSSYDFDGESNRDPQLDAQLQELQDFKAQYEQEKLQANIESALARQENIIRQSNPTYTDEDIQTVYQLSYAYGGDLMTAQKVFEGERNRILSAYANNKGGIPEGITSPSGTGSAQTPQTLSWEEATKYAKQRLAAIDGMGGLNN